MKYLVIILLLCFGANAQTQKDGCNDLSFVSEGNFKSLTSPEADGVSIAKISDGKEIYYQLSVRQPSKTATVKSQGVSVKTASGELISRPDRNFDILQSGKKYEYLAFFELTDAEAKLLASSPIIEKTVGDRSSKVLQGKRILEYVNCQVGK